LGDAQAPENRAEGHQVKSLDERFQLDKTTENGSNRPRRNSEVCSQQGVVEPSLGFNSDNLPPFKVFTGQTVRFEADCARVDCMAVHTKPYGTCCYYDLKTKTDHYQNLGYTRHHNCSANNMRVTTSLRSRFNVYSKKMAEENKLRLYTLAKADKDDSGKWCFPNGLCRFITVVDKRDLDWQNQNSSSNPNSREQNVKDLNSTELNSTGPVTTDPPSQVSSSTGQTSRVSSSAGPPSQVSSSTGPQVSGTTGPPSQVSSSTWTSSNIAMIPVFALWCTVCALFTAIKCIQVHFGRGPRCGTLPEGDPLVSTPDGQSALVESSFTELPDNTAPDLQSSNNNMENNGSWLAIPMPCCTSSPILDVTTETTSTSGDTHVTATIASIAER